MWWERNALALVRPYHADAQSASLRENRPLRYPWVFPAKPSRHQMVPPGGAGSARPKRRHRFDRGMWPVGPKAIFNVCGGKEMPWHWFGRTTRTHRVRPSEKTDLYVIPGFSPQNHLAIRWSPPGGAAPHARDDGITPTPMFPPFGHRPVANSSIIATWLGSPPALPPGRGDRAPPRKSPLALSPGLPRKAI